MDDLNNADLDQIVITDKGSQPPANNPVQTEDVSPKPDNGETVDHQPTEDDLGGSSGAGTGNDVNDPERSQENSEPKSPQFDESHFNSRLSELTGGDAQSWQDIETILEEYNELVQQREEYSKPREIEFPDERSRQAYEFITSRNSGDVGADARLFYHVQSLDVSKMSDKEKQFEAFLLDPDNAELSRDQAREYFDASYEREFADLDVDKSLEYSHRIKTKKAERMIEEMQSKFNQASEKDSKKTDNTGDEGGLTQDQIDEINKSVESSFRDFDELNMSFGDDDEGMNFSLSNAENDFDINSIKEAAKDPSQLVSMIVDQFRDEKGNFDYNGYANELAGMLNWKSLASEAYNYGLNQGKIKEVQERRNPADPKQAGTAPAQQKKSLLDAFEEALKGQS